MRGEIMGVFSCLCGVRQRVRAAGVMVGLAAGLTACGPGEEPAVTAKPRPAKLYVVEEDTIIRSTRLPAIVGAAETSVLTFTVPGVLQELSVVEGDEVKAGDVLARLDQRDFQNDVNAAQAQFNVANADFQRAENLLAQDAISRSAVDQARSAKDVAQATLNNAQKRLEDATLRAPFDGAIAVINVEAFETIGAQQPVMTLQGQGPLEAIVQMPASIVVNAERIVPVYAYVELDAVPGTRFPTMMAEGAGIADPTTQTFEVRFGFSTPDDIMVLPGMTGIFFGQFRLMDDEETDQLAVPLSAIIGEAGATYVWVAITDADTGAITVTRRPVVVLPGVGETVPVAPLAVDDTTGEIVSGLAPGDEIVAAGGHYLSEGEEIRRYQP